MILLSVSVLGLSRCLGRVRAAASRGMPTTSRDVESRCLWRAPAPPVSAPCPDASRPVCVGRGFWRRPRQAGSSAASSPAAAIPEAIKHLGDLDYTNRTRAAASLRRRPPAEVAPALLEALERNTDGYVRFRVLVLLSAFNNPRIPDVMRARHLRSERSPARRRLLVLRGAPRPLDAGHVPRGARQGDVGIRAPLARPRDCRARRRPARAPGDAARGDARAGLLQERRHRSAGRSQGHLRRRRADHHRAASRARCRTMRRWRWGRWETGRRSPCWRACSALRRRTRSRRLPRPSACWA